MDAAYQAADNNLQTQITANDSNITTLQNDVSTNTTNLSQEITDRQNADTVIIGGATINFDTLGKIEGEITSSNNLCQHGGSRSKVRDFLGGASGAYDTLLEIENHITTNATDIGTLLTTMSTKALSHRQV